MFTFEKSSGFGMMVIVSPLGGADCCDGLESSFFFSRSISPWKILNGGVFLLQLIDSLFQRNVLLEQSFGIGLLLRVNLL